MRKSGKYPRATSRPYFSRQIRIKMSLFFHFPLFLQLSIIAIRETDIPPKVLTAISAVQSPCQMVKRDKRSVFLYLSEIRLIKVGNGPTPDISDSANVTSIC